MINARAVGNVVKLIGATCAVVILTVEGATVVWRAPAHVTIVVPDRSCAQADARLPRRCLEVLVDSVGHSAIGRRARAGRARKVLDAQVDAGLLVRICGGCSRINWIAPRDSEIVRVRLERESRWEAPIEEVD